MKQTLLEIKYLLGIADAIDMLQHVTKSTSYYDVQKECLNKAHALWYITYSYKIDSNRDLSLAVEHNLRIIYNAERLAPNIYDKYHTSGS